MNTALLNDERVFASPQIVDAVCPLCKSKVIAKCGTIKIWHFAHKSDSECDSWSEGETKWHIDWKNNFPKDCQEVIIKPHIADVLNKDNIIIELQNSPISPIEITERENFYDNMIWLFNGESLGKGLKLRIKKGIITFRWKHPHKSLWNVTKPMFFDMSSLYGDVEIFQIKKVYENIPCGGWGIKLSKEEFLKKYRGEYGTS